MHFAVFGQRLKCDFPLKCALTFPEAANGFHTARTHVLDYTRDGAGYVRMIHSAHSVWQGAL